MAKNNLVEVQNVDFEFSGLSDCSLSFDVEFPEIAHSSLYFEYYIRYQRNDVIVHASSPIVERLDGGEKTFHIWASEQFSDQALPDKFKFFYRLFKASKSQNIKLSCPPELNKVSGSFSLNKPKKGLLGGNSWTVGSIEVSSIILQLEDDRLSYSLNLQCAKPHNTILEVVGENSTDTNINLPNLIDAPFVTTDRELISGGEDIALELTEHVAQSWIEGVPASCLRHEKVELEEKEVSENVVQSKGPEKKKQAPKKKESDQKKSSDNFANFFKHNVMLVSIGKSFSETTKIYDAARYQWKTSKRRAESVDYVIAHSSGRVVGVFKPKEWLPSDDKAFENLGEALDGRIGFEGEVAEPEVLLEYLNKDIPKTYFPRGAANPVRFIDLTNQ